MKLTQILALLIVILLGVVFFQHNKIKNFQPEPPKTDTVVNYIEVHDTVAGKPKLVKVIDTDTVFYPKIEYLPHPDYDVLLGQYENLIVKHFSKNVFQTTVPIKYGIATIIDTVTENKSIGNQLILDLKFPENTITITKPALLVRQYYLGTIGTLTTQDFLNSVSIGGLYKDKKDRIFGASIGLNGSGNIQYGVSSYIKIK
jgi:hypothetical protein